MDAAQKSGVSADRNIVKDKLLRLALMLGELDDSMVGKIDSAVQYSIDGMPWGFSNLAPKTFTQFLELENPTQSIFNQLASEVPWWELLNQIEEVCFFNKQMIEKAEPFIKGLWEDEVAQNPFKPSKNWRYLPVEEAVVLYQHLLGSNLKVDATLDINRKFKPDLKEGIAVWPKLSTLARIFNVSGNPLEDTEEGRKAYAKIVELFIPKVGETYKKAYPNFSFKNWREGKLTAKHIRLTPAGRISWQRLEETTNDDFVIAPANSGSSYAGYSARRSRIKILLSGNQFPQDCIMVGATLLCQPERLTKFEHLGIDCPANPYSPGAAGEFSYSLCFNWRDDVIHFDNYWAVIAYQYFGSASGLLG